MKIAFAEDWLHGLFTANRQLQLAAGLEWQSLATLGVLLGSVGQLSALAGLPAIDVLIVAVTGTAGYVAIRMGEVELQVQPVDDRGRLVTVSETEQVRSCSRLLLTAVTVRGVAMTRSQTA